MSMLCLWHCNSTQRGPPAASKSSTTASTTQRTLHLGERPSLMQVWPSLLPSAISSHQLQVEKLLVVEQMFNASNLYPPLGKLLLRYVGLTQIQEFWKQIELPNGADEIYVCIGVKASNYFMPAETLSDKGPGWFAGMGDERWYVDGIMVGWSRSRWDIM